MTEEGKTVNDRRCGAREAAKPWGTGYWVCTKRVNPKTGLHKGPHSFEEPHHRGYGHKRVVLGLTIC